uniref:Uncharacterized protein n=1 Tax=Heterorhabditis bacteriophora TaxID=37862 RepID=A0A1I7W8K4_HETBA
MILIIKSTGLDFAITRVVNYFEGKSKVLLSSNDNQYHVGKLLIGGNYGLKLIISYQLIILRKYTNILSCLIARRQIGTKSR